MFSLLQTLTCFSERAAKIARIIRQDPRLFALLVEEKKGLEKNLRFVQDFKTLADVLIQEALRHYVSLTFPMLRDHVKGEENTLFTNSLGEKITVTVFRSQEKTAALLSKVLNGNIEAANVLAQIVHSDQVFGELQHGLEKEISNIQVEDLAVWIDPIDSTGEYVSGSLGTKDDNHAIFHNGLPCVTVLIGVYDRASGIPVAGVINQPFSSFAESRWQSGLHWGVSHQGICRHNMGERSRLFKGKDVIVISSSESSAIQDKLRDHFEVVLSSGAGYKGLTVCRGLADAYLCSKGSTYRWDTNAPHGLLRSLGGGIISYTSLMELGSGELLTDEKEISNHQIRYAVENNLSEVGNPACNSDGIVAYRNPKLLPIIYNSLKHST